MLKNKSYLTNKNKNKTRKMLRFGIPLLVVLFLLIGAYLLYNTTRENSSTTDVVQNETEETINYDPPTPAETAGNDDFKEKQVDSRNNTGSSDGTPKKVSPIITSFEVQGSNMVIYGLVNGFAEETGTCTVSMKKGGASASGTATATQDSQHMNCIVQVPISSLSDGEWDTTLSYSSSAFAGSSAVEKVPVN